MVDRTYRGGRDRYERERTYSRQPEQFENNSWRDDERGQGQMEGWREEDYGQYDTGASYSRDRDTARDWGRDPSYSRRSTVDRPNRDGGRSRYSANETFDRGAGSRLAANHGEWRDYGANPSSENRDYRGTWGGIASEGRGWLDRASDTVSSWFSDDDDYRSRGRGYRGHGPSGYARSDDRINEDVCDRLTEDWAVDARQIAVSVSSGDVTLDGTVPSREQKRRAEDVVADLSGVKNVQNNLRVQERSTWDRGTSDTGTTGTI
jgi:osmotically-inducible protein OsmY